jgi:CDP-diglyceride synthetase
MNTIDPLACALFLIVAFSLAGLVHSAWLASTASRRFSVAIDGGRRFRGRRVFGDNKMVRGFVVMTPAAGLSFWTLAVLLDALSPALRASLWPLSNGQLALLGTWAGLGFMLGELPNSFVKRQLDIAPGAPASGGARGVVGFVADRVDSIIGMLLAISVVTYTPWQTWAYVLTLGPAVHLCFSMLLHRLGVKARAA